MLILRNKTNMDTGIYPVSIYLY